MDSSYSYACLAEPCSTCPRPAGPYHARRTLPRQNTLYRAKSYLAAPCPTKPASPLRVQPVLILPSPPRQRLSCPITPSRSQPLLVSPALPEHARSQLTVPCPASHAYSHPAPSDRAVSRHSCHTGPVPTKTGRAKPRLPCQLLQTNASPTAARYSVSRLSARAISRPRAMIAVVRATSASTVVSASPACITLMSDRYPCSFSAPESWT